MPANLSAECDWRPVHGGWVFSRCEGSKITIHIVDLPADDQDAIHQVAAMLVDGFATNWPDAWPNLESALQEVRESFGAGRISRIARGEDSSVLGWVGGIEQYHGHVWELHPLVVRVGEQGQGIGRALVADLEEQVRKRGGLTVTLGTDDQNEQTSLSGVDLYPHIWEQVTHLRNLKHHPYEFYLKQGYVIVGVIPDANGLGKPDILMAKSLVR